MYDKSDVYQKTLKYFEGNGLATTVFMDKYALKDSNGNFLEKSPDDMHVRISKEFARIQKRKYKDTVIKPLSEKEIYDYLKYFKHIIPQGSPMYGIGNNHQYVSLSNCYVLHKPQDSYGSIIKTDEELVQISKRRGGVGIDISNIRPDNTPTSNSSRYSTGIIPFMKRYSNSTRETSQAGRRGALMLTLDIHHPEAVSLDDSIMDFTTVKKDLTEVTGANISLRLSDEFMHAVKKDDDYEVRFPVDYKERKIKPIVSYKQNAKKAWEKIIKSAHGFAEPGLLLWNNIIKESPADCYKDDGFESVSTNPCSEIPLCEHDSCRLMLINLFNCVKNPYTKKAEFDFRLLKKLAYTTQLLMDDLVDLELEKINAIIKKIKTDPESVNIKSRELELWNNIKNKCIKGRRTGTGITALGDTLAALNVKYGNAKSMNMVDDIYKCLKLGAYEASINMAQVLGSFPIWDRKKEKDNPFLNRIKKESPKLHTKMCKYGRRNISLLTTAPAGSVSILACMDINNKRYFNTTSGIEPNFTNVPYTRKRKVNPHDTNIKVDEIDQNGDKWNYYNVYPSGLQAWMDINGSENIETSPYNNSSADCLDWINRVKLQSIITKHLDHSVSSTLNLPSDISIQEVGKIYQKAWEMGCKGITIYRDGCRTGVLVKDDTSNTKNLRRDSVKRPKKIKCDVYHSTSKGDVYYVVIGLFENKPYEVFAGINNSDIPKSITDGYLTKKSRGKYELENDKFSYMLTNDDSNEYMEALARMLSVSLRHNVNINFIVHQLEKTKGDIMSFSKVVAKCLKKYIPDGESVSGESCPICEKDNTLRRQDGCVICVNCGFTKC